MKEWINEYSLTILLAIVIGTHFVNRVIQVRKKLRYLNTNRQEFNKLLSETPYGRMIKRRIWKKEGGNQKEKSYQRTEAVFLNNGKYLLACYTKRENETQIFENLVLKEQSKEDIQGFLKSTKISLKEKLLKK